MTGDELVGFYIELINVQSELNVLCAKLHEAINSHDECAKKEANKALNPEEYIYALERCGICPQCGKAVAECKCERNKIAPPESGPGTKNDGHSVCQFGCGVATVRHEGFSGWYDVCPKCWK